MKYPEPLGRGGKVHCAFNPGLALSDYSRRKITWLKIPKDHQPEYSTLAV
jgi:hypothetical protein